MVRLKTEWLVTVKRLDMIDLQVLEVFQVDGVDRIQRVLIASQKNQILQPPEPETQMIMRTGLNRDFEAEKADPADLNI